MSEVLESAPEFDAGCYQKTTLENGLRVITERMPHVRSLALGFLIDAGPCSETGDQSGLAHLTEHLLFQGTSNRNAQQIARLMDLAGGQIGGFTTRDYTCYFASVLDEHCTYALDLFGDLFLNSTFSENSLRREKEAILHEMEACRDAPSQRVHDLLKAHAWSGHPLGRPIAGRRESVERFSREDVIYFFHEHYTPDRMILAAAGQVDHKDFVAQARDAFWRLLGERGINPPRQPKFHGGLALETAAVAQAYFALGIPAPAYGHPGRYGVHVIANVLGGGISSRLFQSLREERGLVYHVAADYHAYRDAGMLVIEGSTAAERLPEVLKIIFTEIQQLSSGKAALNDEDVWKARVQIRRQHLLDAENTNTRMSRLATQELYFGRHLPANEVLSNIEAIDGPSIKRLMAEWLAPALKQAAVAVVTPGTKEHRSLRSLEELLARSN
ncbi:MAG: M16 family metallopeptidase [Gemmataceae bacterium]